MTINNNLSELPIDEWIEHIIHKVADDVMRKWREDLEAAIRSLDLSPIELDVISGIAGNVPLFTIICRQNGSYV